MSDGLWECYEPEDVCDRCLGFGFISPCPGEPDETCPECNDGGDVEGEEEE